MTNLALTPEVLQQTLDAHRISIPAPQVEQLAQYASLLWNWNDKLNLTRHTTPEKFVGRDLLDSLALARHLAKGEKILDVGTGGGVPGVILKIVRPDLSVWLCEPVGKKATAVADIVDHLGILIPTCRAHAQDLLSSTQFNSLVIRGVTSMSKMLEWFRPYYEAFDRLLLVKGPAWIEERKEARHFGWLSGMSLRRLESYPIPGADAESVILQVCPQDRFVDTGSDRERLEHADADVAQEEDGNVGGQTLEIDATDSEATSVPTEVVEAVDSTDGNDGNTEGSMETEVATDPIATFVEASGTVITIEFAETPSCVIREDLQDRDNLWLASAATDEELDAEAAAMAEAAAKASHGEKNERRERRPRRDDGLSKDERYHRNQVRQLRAKDPRDLTPEEREILLSRMSARKGDVQESPRASHVRTGYDQRREDRRPGGFGGERREDRRSGGFGGERREDRRPGGFGGERREDRRSGGFGGERREDRRSGGFGGERREDRRSGGFGGERREDRRPGGFGGERREDRRSGGFGGERREDRRPGGFGGERREDRRSGGFGGERREDRRAGGFGGERREDRRSGGFGGERREDRRPGGFGGERREDRRAGGFGGERREDRRSGGFGGERREDRRPGGFGGERREDRRPGGFGGERREDRRSGGFGGERREDRRSGGFGGERREDRRPGGFGGERREDRRPGGFGGERREDRRSGGFGGERREDRRSGGFGGERREDRRSGGFGGQRYGRPEGGPDSRHGNSSEQRENPKSSSRGDRIQVWKPGEE